MIVHRAIAYVCFCSVAILIAGCDKETSTPIAPAQTAKLPAAATSDDHGHDHGSSAHGAVIELGTATIGPFNARAAREQGEIKAGGDATIDVWLTGNHATVVAVRFWIGVESADGSVKAKSEIEDSTQPNHWHTHAEIPNPMPAESKLWIEIEVQDQAKHVGSFELKTGS